MQKTQRGAGLVKNCYQPEAVNQWQTAQILAEESFKRLR